jgi:hypothetical protein
MSPDMRQGAVEYLLGELSPAESERFESGLQIDPALRAEVLRLGPVVSGLEDRGEEAWAPLDPPPLDIAAIVEADPGPVVHPAAIPDGLQGESTPEPLSASRGGSAPRRRRSPSGVLGFTWPRIAVGAFSALFMLLGGVWVGTQLGGENAVGGRGPVQTVQLQAFGEEAPADASGKVLMTSGSDGPGDQMTLDVSGLDQSGDREFYELWLLGEQGELVALGSFRVSPDGRSTIEVPLPVNPDRYRYFDVSIQPENGDPQHSGRSVLRGLTTS